MKTSRALLPLAVLLAVLSAARAHAAPITVITNYYHGYVCTTSGWQTVEESGLATNTVYACIPLSALTGATAAALAGSGSGSDVRVLWYTFNDAAYTAYIALDSTNRPANAQLSRSSSSSTITNYATMHTLRTIWTLTTPTLTPE